MRPRILLDVDGVICDFITPVVKAINHMMGTSRTVDDVTQWDIGKALGAPLDVMKELDYTIRSPGFCQALAPYAGAVDFVNALREFADVYPVTAPYDSPHWVGERGYWLQSLFGFDRKSIVYTDAKHVCAGDALIDDKASTLETWGTEYPDRVPILFDRPWNRRSSDHLLRVLGYNHAIDYLKLKLL